ncbi:MAG TPA: hypothetical protein VF274_00460 [Alphaproteobacteria bacterium]
MRQAGRHDLWHAARFTGVEFAIAAASAAISAAGAVAQGNAAKSAANFNAAVARRNADIARANAAADAARQKQRGALLAGRQRAAAGASGITAEGSPLDVMADSAIASELDALTTRYRGELQARAYGQDATLQDMRGDAAQTAGYIGAGAALLSSAKGLDCDSLLDSKAP